MSRVLSTDPDKIDTINKFVKEGKIPRMVLYWMSRESLSENYGWTPDQIDRMDVEDINIYLAILKGKGEGRKHGKDGTMGGTKGINPKIPRRH